MKQFSSIVPEAEIMCATNTGDGQTATARSPLRNLKSTRKTTERTLRRELRYHRAREPRRASGSGKGAA